MTCTLVFGGARCGKSAYAERLAEQSSKDVVYLATAQGGDTEMQARIATHHQRRNQSWLTVEEPLALGDAILQRSTAANLVLVDCLTVWLSNLLFTGNKDYPEVGHIEPPAAFHVQRERFLHAVQHAGGDVVMVSNEVGMGIVPQGAISRWFVDEAGRLNQAVAAQCERVVWVAAGLPLVLKG